MGLDRALVADALDTIDLYTQLYPENFDDEKERFQDAHARGDDYDPQYVYPRYPHDTADDLLDQVAAQCDDPLDHRLHQLLQARHRLIASIGTGGFTTASADYFGAPDDDTVQQARDLFRPPPDGDASIDAATLRDAFAHLFDRLDADYDCRLVDTASTRNDPVDREIILPADTSYTPLAARRTLIHESTHAVRGLNGLHHGHPALIYGTAGYETVEEGLTTANEAAVDVFAATRPKIAARVIAVAMRDRPFHAVYDAMRDLGLPERIAYLRAYRVKRGLTDTAQPGGFTKDHIYFSGYRQLQRRDDLDALYVGKIGFDDLDLIDTAPHVTRQHHLDAYQEAAETLEP